MIAARSPSTSGARIRLLAGGRGAGAGAWNVLARVAAYRALHHGPLRPVLLATTAWFAATTAVIIAVLAASMA